MRTNIQRGSGKDSEPRRERAAAVSGVSPSPAMPGLCPAGSSGSITNAHMSLSVGMGCPPSSAACLLGNTKRLSQMYLASTGCNLHCTYMHHLKLPMVCNKLLLLTILILAAPDLVTSRQGCTRGDTSQFHFRCVRILELSPSFSSELCSLFLPVHLSEVATKKSEQIFVHSTNRSALYIANWYLCDAGRQCPPPDGILCKETSKTKKGYFSSFPAGWLATNTTNRREGIDTCRNKK